MNQLDIYYRALFETRSLIEKSRESAAFARAMLSFTDAESITVVRNVCTVDEDWVSAIEEGLVYIEKAIAQERQFIRSMGEVAPIEKVKQVTKESVQHLAKHSELITREQRGEEIIPDALYNVERLNDYTVYENRFLYMLLCYLRDFTSERYNKLVELWGGYEISLALKKEISYRGRRVSYNIELCENGRDMELLKDYDSTAAAIDRISLLLKGIISCLSTPLMELAAKTPMLKPPITKTNVLKMDKHFKKTVELYDYIMAYGKKGYEVNKKRTEISPFDGELALEAADVCAMLSFLTYKYGFGIGSSLKSAYEAEEERRRHEEIRQRSDRLEALRKRHLRAEGDGEEYILTLEDQLRAVETELRRGDSAREEVKRMRAKEDELNARIVELKEEKAAVSGELEAIEDKQLAELESLRESYGERAKNERESYELKSREMFEKYSAEISAVRTEADSLKIKLDEAAKESAMAARKADSEMEALLRRAEAAEAERDLANGRLKAYRAEKGITEEGDGFSDKESFDRLEKEYKAFCDFYNREWGRAKRKIRKDLLNLKKLKGQGGKN